MTIETCVDFCTSKGHTYAGMEFGSQCYCDNKLPADRAPIAGMLRNCIMPCAGNSAEKCGGHDAIILYQKASGASTKGSTGSSKRRSRIMRSLEI